MQAGIPGQLPQGTEVIRRVVEVLGAAREGGFPVFFSCHVSLPKELMGASQLRQQMAWQHVDRPEDVRSPFPPDASHSQIVPELELLPSGAVSDKIAMSAFSGTFLDTAMRATRARLVRRRGRRHVGRYRAHGAPRDGPRLRARGRDRHLRRGLRGGSATLRGNPQARRRRVVHRRGDHLRPLASATRRVVHESAWLKTGLDQASKLATEKISGPAARGCQKRATAPGRPKTAFPSRFPVCSDPCKKTDVFCRRLL